MRKAIVFLVCPENLRDFWGALMSLLGTRGEHAAYPIYVLCRDISQRTVDAIAAMGDARCRIFAIDVRRNERCVGLLRTNPNVPADDALRYALAYLLPDVDIALAYEPAVLFFGDVSALLDRDLGTAYAAALLDFEGMRSRPTACRKYQILNHKRYFKVDVLLLNLRHIRRLHMWKKLLSFHARNGRVATREIVYNVVLGSNIASLPVSAGYPSSLENAHALYLIEGFYDVDLPSDTDARRTMMVAVSYRGVDVRQLDDFLYVQLGAWLSKSPDACGVARTLPPRAGVPRPQPTVSSFPRPSFARLTKYLAGTQWGCAREPSKDRIVVSLTTIPARIDSVALVVYQMLHQTKKPDRVCLWLAQEQFPLGEAELPENLLRLREHGLEICWADENLGPHTKYHFAIREDPDAVVITVDDDVVYPVDLVEALVKSYHANPKAVSALRAHLITFTPAGAVAPYRQWGFECSLYVDEPLMSLCATGVGGVLYPPHLFIDEMFNRAALKELALRADDIWLKAFEVLSGVPVVLVRPNVDLEFFADTQEVGLLHGNVSGGGNDLAVAAVVDRYDRWNGDEDTLLGRMRRDQQLYRPALLPVPSTPREPVPVRRRVTRLKAHASGGLARLKGLMKRLLPMPTASLVREIDQVRQDVLDCTWSFEKRDCAGKERLTAIEGRMAGIERRLAELTELMRTKFA